MRRRNGFPLRGLPLPKRRTPRTPARPALPLRALPEGAVILGVDPGTRVVGYGAVVLGRRAPRLLAAGVIRTGPNDPVPERLAQVARGLEALIGELAPAVVVVEQAFAALNIQSALRIGEGRGVALACAARAGCGVVQHPPAVVKRALVGHGQAHKTQVAAMVARLLGLTSPPKPLDATDALALALTHAMRVSTLAIPRAREARKLPGRVSPPAL